MVCGDCGVAPGNSHLDGCDVGLCTECGWQRIACEHENSDIGWGAIWSGETPARETCRDLNLYYPDGEPRINEMDRMCRAGLLTWNRQEQKWTRP